MREELSLFELNEFIRRFVALNVPEAVWITAEISQANLNRGHYYIDLVQKADDTQQIIAQSYAVLWATTLGNIAPTKTSNITHILKEGLKVKLRVRVDFHEKYGLKLVIEDIDENYTYGNLALERAKIIKELQSKNLIDKNRMLAMPKMIKRIAVLSSRTAAGLKDFVTHLNSNEYGYTFGIELFPMAVQGQNVERDFLQQIASIDWTSFDLVAIIRGGGSKIDLAAFDNFAICEAIANCPTPVVTGIGHEIDETIADMVAKLSLKTPTAVASYIINHNLELESRLVQIHQDIGVYAKQLLQQQKVYLQKCTSEIPLIAKQALANGNNFLLEAEQKIKFFSENRLKMAKNRLIHWHETIHFLSIENTLSRGFTVTRDDKGIAINKSKKLKKGDKIVTQFSDGTRKSIIE